MSMAEILTTEDAGNTEFECLRLIVDLV